MPKIIFVEHSGVDHHVEVDSGVTIMQAAIDNLVPGIDADCGGECSCATCHVYLDQEWSEKFTAPGSEENSMLDLNPERHAGSRLSCQLVVTDEIDGIVVKLPEYQM